ncbi:hypothetical protein B0T21DRAFT_89633 [Apiosordaria backusii]|uniref:Apple domain-containing protein n=1 Tax=Apiosordaria backusii TaxID=314023 RepID=A0AA40K3G6_9PEZI|nr:hypothetical protein B0T21DRAFT_89633 [Apiosordaria backusii]
MEHQGFGHGQPAPYYQLQEGIHVPEKPSSQSLNNTQVNYQSSGVPVNVPYHEQPTLDQNQTILSVKRSLALATVGVIVFLCLAVIGLSAGLGISQRHLTQTKSELQSLESSLAFALAAPTSSSRTSTTTLPAPPPPSSTSSVAIPSSTASSTTTSVSRPTVPLVQCPDVNNTIYTTSNNLKFVRLCGRDFSGEDEAIDIGNTKTNSLDLCIEACAKRPGCEGVGWGVIVSNDKGNVNPMQSCWMKKDLRKSHDAQREDWGFARLIEAS